MEYLIKGAYKIEKNGHTLGYGVICVMIDGVTSQETHIECSEQEYKFLDKICQAMKYKLDLLSAKPENVQYH